MTFIRTVSNRLPRTFPECWRKTVAAKDHWFYGFSFLVFPLIKHLGQTFFDKAAKCLVLFMGHPFGLS